MSASRHLRSFICILPVSLSWLFPFLLMFFHHLTFELLFSISWFHDIITGCPITEGGAPPCGAACSPTWVSCQSGRLRPSLPSCHPPPSSTSGHLASIITLQGFGGNSSVQNEFSFHEDVVTCWKLDSHRKLRFKTGWFSTSSMKNLDQPTSKPEVFTSYSNVPKPGLVGNSMRVTVGCLRTGRAQPHPLLQSAREQAAHSEASRGGECSLFFVLIQTLS